MINSLTEDSDPYRDDVLETDFIEVTFYTDPLCCWSWAFEPQWRKLQYLHRDQLRVRYVMSGLLPEWKKYNDPLFSVSRPAQMGPVWLEAARLSGMPLYDRIWVEDPPASSFPACIAVKCAALQSKKTEVQYLRVLREAIMIEGKNPAKQNILVEAAQKLSDNIAGSIDVNLFEEDLINGNGLEAFRADWKEVQEKNITRFPTLLIRRESKAVMLTGYQPYPILYNACKQVAPLFGVEEEIPSHENYMKFWGNLTERELMEIES